MLPGTMSAARAEREHDGGAKPKVVLKTGKRRCYPTLSIQNLSTQAESREHLLIALRIGPGEIIEKFPATGDHSKESATGRSVLFIGRQVLGQMVDAGGQEGDLHVCTSGVAGMELKFHGTIA